MKLNHWVAIVVMMTSLANTHAGTANTTIPTNATLVAPNSISPVSWQAITRYPQGSVIKVDDNYYFALVGGTSDVTEPWGYSSFTDGTVKWISLPKQRKGIIITLLNSEPCYISFGEITSSEGIPMFGQGDYFMDDSFDKAIYVKSVNGGSEISVMTW